MTLAMLCASATPALAEDGARAETAGVEKTQKVGVDEHLGELVPLSDLTFTDEDGNPVKLSELVDRPVALSLVYFRCGALCSPLLQDLAKATDNGTLQPGEDFRMISVSFDPKDTFEMAKHKKESLLGKMKKKKPSSDSWRFLVGNQENIERLTKAVGFNFMQTPDGQDFNHPGVVMFLGKDGKICRYLYGTEFNPVDVRMAVEDAARGEPRSIIRKITQLCFAYDPVGRTYVLQINRIILAITGLFALSFLGFLVLRRRPATELPSGPSAPLGASAKRSEA